MSEEITPTRNKIYGEDITEPVKALWYTLAKRVEPNLPTQGNYERNYPLGAVIHYTAGNYGDSAIAEARKQGYCYFYIDKDGTVYQGAPLNRWGSHAGVSYATGIGEGVSQHLVGIEVGCAGLLEPDGAGGYKSWWGKKIAQDNIRRVKRKVDNQKIGVYHKFTKEQENAMFELILWLKMNNPDIFRIEHVYGHDEVAPSRKSDPGGSLSMTMPRYRSYIRQFLPCKYRD